MLPDTYVLHKLKRPVKTAGGQLTLIWRLTSVKRKLTLFDKAELAMKAAIKKVVEQHKKDSRPLVVWENGKVKKIPASEL